MKTTEIKNKFIALRAEGKSYADICKELCIAKATCSAWEKEFKAQIAELKQDQLDELINSYYMTQEARIKRLGDTLNQINDTLSTSDLSKLPPDKLLDFKLKYTMALKEEFGIRANGNAVTIIFSGENNLTD